jgi:hypothetical protein
MKADIEDLHNDIRQLQNNHNIVSFNPVEEFGIEMPIESMNEFLEFDESLNNQEISEKFVSSKYRYDVNWIIIIIYL